MAINLLQHYDDEGALKLCEDVFYDRIEAQEYDVLNSSKSLMMPLCVGFFISEAN